MTWIVIAALLCVAWMLAYFGRGAWAWIAPCGLGLAYWAWHLYDRGLLEEWLGGRDGETIAFWVLAAVWLAAALLLGPTPLRSGLLGPLAYKLVAPILPRMSETERIALEAGTVWFDRDLFSGAPNWKHLLDFRCKPLSAEERAFLDGPCEELCRVITDHEVAQLGDLPGPVWDRIKQGRFMGMIIPKEYGGLGFSAIAHSAVVTKLSSRCATLAVSVMVPNSLGPAELLLHYGTEEQKRHWLPRLADGREVPCFALTEPTAGSDAGSMRARGIVCRGSHGGREVLGMRLSWNKRYITLAPIATVLGLAFVLEDPDRLLGGEADLGITCALIPAATPGVELGERHDPLGVPFHNGPTRGRDVFVPLDFIIGGPKMAGQGWRMLMQCLAAGRGISLPSLSTGASQLTLRATSAYASVREQFGLPIGRFEGVEEPIARIASLTYAIDATRRLTAGAVDAGEQPSVLSAIAKRWTTEGMRTVINDGMDVMGGAAISRGPRNILATAYMATPIGITVEGANILTRSMIVFGQGAIRCHPWAQREMMLAAERDVAGFQRAFFSHVAFVFQSAARSAALGLTRGRLAQPPTHGPSATYLRRLTYLSSAFAFSADLAMGTLGSDLKRMEKVTGRLADCLAWMYLASASIKRWHDDGERASDLPLMRWSVEHALHEGQAALRGFLDNFPVRAAALLARPIVLPPGSKLNAPSDRLGAAAARCVLEGGPARDGMTADIFRPDSSELGLGALERALAAALAAREPERKLKDALRARKIAREPAHSLVERAVDAGVLSGAERTALDNAERERWAAVQVDSFAPAEFARLR
ncbi:MAG: acyl-CoA dehydrogenase [Planctomycetes bacterium]|nr:acyl-CoA dehydrogenase [Planctomycetota bacterium]